MPSNDVWMRSKSYYLEKANESVNFYHMQYVSSGTASEMGHVAWVCSGNAVSQSSASSEVLY